MEDTFADDVLFIMAKGLGVERFFINHLHLYNDQRYTVLVINANDEDEHYFLDRLREMNKSLPPRRLDHEVLIKDREMTFSIEDIAANPGFEYLRESLEGEGTENFSAALEYFLDNGFNLRDHRKVLISIQADIRRFYRKLGARGQLTGYDTGNITDIQVSVRDALLRNEFGSLMATVEGMPSCSLTQIDGRFDELDLTVNPVSGDYQDGTFEFRISVLGSYCVSPPLVNCRTRIWHPNVSEDGAVRLSILRDTPSDPAGWSSLRTVLDVVLELDRLFTDLINFEDPLNREAAEMHEKSEEEYREKVQEYVRRYASG